MPRPLKQRDQLKRSIETAIGSLLIQNINRKITLLRLRQAIQRHPDLIELLAPVERELLEIQTRAERAKNALYQAQNLIDALK